MDQEYNLNTGNYEADNYEIKDVKDHPAHNMPKSKHEGGTVLGTIPIGPNDDLGDE